MKYEFLNTEIYETPCPECKAYSFPISKENMANYFSGNEIKCKNCHVSVDWWKLLLRHFEWEIPAYLYAIVGGFTTSFRINLKLNEKFSLNLEEIGIPDNAKVLQINYTPNGSGLIPIEVHGNTPFRHFLPKEIILFGMPFGNNPEEVTNKGGIPISIQIYWINSSEDEILESLISSVEAFSIKKYNSCVVPSNVSIEATLTKLLSSYLNNYVGKDRVENFLSSGATYSHQLNVLLPLISEYEKFPKLPEFIRGSLNELRGLRNEIAHQGKTLKEIDKNTISKLICSSAFGLSYLKLLEEKIIK